MSAHPHSPNTASRSSTTLRVLLAGLAAALPAGLAGCSNPLGSRDSDRGQTYPRQTLREAHTLNVEQFKSEKPIPQIDLSAMDVAAIPAKLPSRFEGLTTVPLSIEQVRAETLRNNLALQVSLLDPTIASESLRAERAKFEAVFRPSINYRNDDRPTLQTTIPNQQKITTVDAALDIPLRTGGRVGVDLVTSKNESPSAVLVGAKTFATDLQFSISQPLLRNAGEGVTTASIRIAGFNQQLAEAGTKLVVINQLAAVERQYWLLYAARRELEVRQQQYELALEQLNQAQRRLDSGDVIELEVTRARSGFAERIEAIIISENSVLRAQRALKRVMNMQDLDVETSQLIIPATEPSPARFDLDNPRLLALARDQRMELVQTELQLLADAVNEGVARNQILPLLNVQGSYVFSSLAETLQSDLTNAARARYQSFTAGVSAEIPLGNEAAEARLSRAVLTRLQRITNKKDQEQSIRQDVLDAADRVRAGWQRILAARQASILAGRTLDGERRQNAQGVRTSTDVLDAAARLADAQSSEIRALADYQIALVDLSVATGTVLGASSIAWDPVPASAADTLKPVYVEGSPALPLEPRPLTNDDEK